MALTEEQTSQLELQTALIAAQATSQAATDAKRAKLEAIRLSKDILVENRRTATAADAEDITAADITTMANELATYVSS
jgi:hypothetical protein